MKTPRNGPDSPGNGLELAVSSGNYRAGLVALRDRLAAAIDGASDRQLVHVAPLARQLADVMRVIEELPVPDAAADSVESAAVVVERKLRSVR